MAAPKARIVRPPPGRRTLLVPIDDELLEVEVVPHLEPGEFFERYRIEGSVDVDALRRAWEGDAAAQALRELE